MRCGAALVASLLCSNIVAAQLQAQLPDRQELTFGVTEGARLTGQQPDAEATVKQLHFTSESTKQQVSASDLYHLAVSLLDSLTAHSSPAPPSSYTPLLRQSSYTPFLDYLEGHLGATTGSALRASRSALSCLYAGSDSKRRKASPSGGRDWSVRGAVNGLKRLVTDYAALSKPARAGRHRGPNGWRAKLEAASGLRAGDVVLDDGEVKEAMAEVTRLARQAAEAGSAEAWVLLGDLHLSGHLSLAPNATTAAEAYTKASQGWGSAEAQYKLGFLYGSNYGKAFGETEGEGHRGSALLHYTFAALSGHAPASMTVGYRHWVGVGTKKSCKEALSWYKAAADEAMRTFNAGPPGGRHLPPPKLRLSDLQGGVYGPGASSSSLLQNTGGSPQREWDDLLEYYHFHADQGDLRDMYKLGRLYYQGFGGNGLGATRGGRGRLDVGQPGLSDRLHDGGRDFVKASKWFMALATKVWKKDPAKEAVTSPTASKRARNEAPKLYYDASKDVKITKDEGRAAIGALAAGHLGRMYLRGEGTTANYAKAFLWFQRGATHGDRESNNGLGIMYRDGLGVDRDLAKANLYFHAAAQQDLADAQVNLGKYHFGMGEHALATTYFKHALSTDNKRQPDTFQSYYYLAELNARALNRDEQCPLAVSFYKLIAERGDWDHEVWWEAEKAYADGDEKKAFLGYWIMAERGYEAAQNNVAWMLDRDKQRLRLPFIDPEPASNETDRMALTYWTRSAAQDNVDALVKMGDYYYAGIGTDEPQHHKAAACYQSATTTRMSAMALWNLGWMHENGKGVAQDYHLAKRFYDQALETSSDSAYFPATLSLVGLYARALYHVIFTPTDDSLKALSLFGDAVSFQNDDGTPPSWSLGRVWREIQRRWGLDVGPEEAFEGRERAQGGGANGQNAEQRVIDGGDEQAERRERERERDRKRVGEEDDEFDFMWDAEGDFGGTVAIVSLCVILAWLLYLRQGRLPEPHGAAPRPVPADVPPRPPMPEERLV